MSDIERTKQVRIRHVTRFRGDKPIDPKELRAAIGDKTRIVSGGPTLDIFLHWDYHQEVPGDTSITFEPTDEPLHEKQQLDKDNPMTAKEAGEAFVDEAIKYEKAHGMNFNNDALLNSTPRNGEEGHAMTPDSKWAPLGGQQKGDG